MKKSTRILYILVCIAIAAFMLVGCSDPGAPEYKKADPSTYAVSVESVTEKLDGFMEGREDRTRYTDGERAAAECLRDTLVGYGYVDEVSDDQSEAKGMLREFYTREQVTLSNGNTATIERRSQNVVAVYEPDGLAASHKNIVIGAYYDNCYSSPNENSDNATKSHGALANGTGVAALLAISEYLQVKKPSLDFTVTIAFFGASAMSSVGATKFYDEMTAEEKTGTVLMIELQRLGVDHVYAFSDARETKREPFFDRIAKENGLDIYKATQKSPVMTALSGLDGIPYYQWVMNGDFAVFFNHNIPTLNIVGANWETLDLTDAESSDHDDIELTASDTLKNLKKLYPDYGEKIAAAATLVVESITDEGFLSTMNYDREHFPNTDVLTKGWIWNLVVIGIVIVAGIIMMLVTSRLGKKYPIVAPKPRKMKMAVFGMEYEDKKDDEIYIDIRQAVPDDEIFPGVPNNDKAPDFNNPFPEFPPIVEGGENKPEDKAVNNTPDDVFDLGSESRKSDVKAETDASAAQTTAPETADEKETESKDEVSEKAPDVEKPREGKTKPTGEKKTPAKTSAPKAARATPNKRTAMAKKPIKSDKDDATDKKSDSE